MKQLKVGIIGCGFIANGKHLPNLVRMEDVEVVAFCDILIERAQASAAKYGAEDALVCRDYRDVLEREDIDVVHICTPNNSHSEMTVAALQAGKHVMCEKPMAKTAAGAKAMLEASRQTGKQLTIGYQNCFREELVVHEVLMRERGPGRDLSGEGVCDPTARGADLGGVHGQREAGGRAIDRFGDACVGPDAVDDAELRAYDGVGLDV